jgi:hypothetical protein
VAAGALLLLVPAALADGTRSLGACYTPGTPLSVSISASPPLTIQVYAVEDAPPAGWTVGGITEGGAWDAVNGKVKWGPFFDHTARVLAYQATPPGGERGSKNFIGTLSADGVNSAIGGTSAVSSCAGGARAARTLPGCYAPGSPAAVSIATTPDAGTQVYAVEDAPPAGWSVSSISAGGSFDQANAKVKWGPFFDADARNLTYAATPPAGESGSRTFVGTISADGVNVAVTGTSVVAICQNGPDLTGSWSSLAHTCKLKQGVEKCTIKGKFTVRNVGDQAAGASQLRWLLSTDAIADTADAAIKTASVATLKPGKTKSVSLSYALPAGTNARGKYVIVVVDAGLRLTERNEANNAVPRGPM